jgi:hypothetical protein
MASVTRYIAVIMLVGMLLQTNCVGVYYGLFFLNQKAISETVCEKKVANCCGHCYLKKQIDATNDPQPASPERQTSTKTLEDLLNSLSGLLPETDNALPQSSEGNSFTAHPACLLPEGIAQPIDHPPNA